MKRIFLLLSLAALLANTGFSQSAELTTFILIRHAEKANDGTRDPGLTTEGEARAVRFKDLFVNTEIKGIYSTDYKRTKSTIAPLATALGQEIQLYQPTSRQFIEDIFATHKGSTVVISGHSNTTPLVANVLLGEEKFKQLDESEYGKIFIVTLSEIGKGTVTIINY